MKITSRTFSDTADLQQMMALANAFPADNLHVVDQPYRFSSWALDEPENTQLWLDEQENVVAWVVMQTPFWSIDYACHPVVSEEVHPQLLRGPISGHSSWWEVTLVARCGLSTSLLSRNNGFAISKRRALPQSPTWVRILGRRY